MMLSTYAQGGSNARRIDVHHHFIPPAYVEFTKTKNQSLGPVFGDRGGPGNVPWDLSKDLDDMDRSGTAVALLSVAYPGFWFGKQHEVRGRWRMWFWALLSSEPVGRLHWVFFLLLGLPLLAQTDLGIGQRRQIKTAKAVFEVVEHGTGETIVLVPGRGGVLSFRRLAPVLAEAGYRCLVVDRTLTSEARATSITGLTLREYALELGQAIEALGRVPVHVIGHVGGAFVGAMLASERPDIVKSLVVMPAGPTDWPLPPSSAEIQEATRKQRAIRITDQETFEEACRLMRVTVFSPSTPEAVVHEYITGLLKEFTAQDGSAYQSWANAGPPWDMAATGAGKWIEGGVVPILGIHGLDDRIVPPELGRRWKRRIGDRGRLVELPNAGHVLLFEQPQAVAKAILAFYQTLSAKKD